MPATCESWRRRSPITSATFGREARSSVIERSSIRSCASAAQSGTCSRPARRAISPDNARARCPSTTPRAPGGPIGSLGRDRTRPTVLGPLHIRGEVSSAQDLPTTRGSQGPWYLRRPTHQVPSSRRESRRHLDGEGDQRRVCDLSGARGGVLHRQPSSAPQCRRAFTDGTILTPARRRPGRPRGRTRRRADRVLLTDRAQRLPRLHCVCRLAQLLRGPLR